MTDVKLLPLPELPRQVEGYNSDYWEAGQIEEYAADYARANVSHATAALQAEIEARGRRAEAMSDDINLPPLPAQQCAQEQDGEYSREDDPNFNEAMTGDLLAQAEYWDAVARKGGRSDE